MSPSEVSHWSYLQIVGRRRSVTDDAEWLCVKRYGDDTDTGFATDELARLRSGESVARLFVEYAPGDVEYRLERVTSYQYQRVEVLA